MDVRSYPVAAKLLAKRATLAPLFAVAPDVCEDVAGGPPTLALRLSDNDHGIQSVWISWHAAFQCPALWIEPCGTADRCAMLATVEALLRRRWEEPARVGPALSAASAPTSSAGDVLTAMLSLEQHPHFGSGGPPCILLHPCRTPEILAEMRLTTPMPMEVSSDAAGIVAAHSPDTAAPCGAAGMAFAGPEAAYRQLLSWCSLMLPCVGIDMDPRAFAAEVRRIEEATAGSGIAAAGSGIAGSGSVAPTGPA